MSKPVADSLASAGVKLLTVGTMAAGLGAGLAGVVGWLASSALAGGSALFGGLISLLALGGSQAVLTAARRLTSASSLIAALTAYGLAIGGVILATRWLSGNFHLIPWWLGIGIVVGAVGYLAGAIWIYRRLRLLVFSPDNRQLESPSDHQDDLS